MGKLLDHSAQVLDLLKERMLIAKENLTREAFLYVEATLTLLELAIEDQDEDRVLESLPEACALIYSLDDVNELANLALESKQ